MSVYFILNRSMTSPSGTNLEVQEYLDRINQALSEDTSKTHQ